MEGGDTAMFPARTPSGTRAPFPCIGGLAEFHFTRRVRHSFNTYRSKSEATVCLNALFDIGAIETIPSIFGRRCHASLVLSQRGLHKKGRRSAAIS